MENRQIRQNIKNAHLCSSIEEMEQAKKVQNEYGKSVLDEMIQECLDQNVDNYGKTE